MADFGAEVVRIENSRHLDVARTVGPFVNDVPGTDSSGLLFNMTTGKRSLGLDLTHRGRPRGARRPRPLGRRPRSSRTRRAASWPSASSPSGCASSTRG